MTGEAIDIPPAWEHCAEKIVSAGLDRVLVLGAADAGKSTFCRFLCRRLLGTGEKVAFIDADIGQKDLGPPACITSGYPGQERLYPPAAGTSLYFVGATTPVGHFLPVMVGLTGLIGSTPASFRIINTTGLIHGIGRALKIYKIESVRPDAIVAIQKSRELEVLLKAHRNFRVMRVPASSRAATKTPDQRKAARERAWAAYFAEARNIILNVDEIIFQRSLIFNGKPVAGTDFIYCEQSAEGTFAVTGRNVEKKPRLRVLPPGFEQNLLCGLANGRGSGLGLGIIRKIDFRERTIALLSPVAPAMIRIIQFGDMYVGPDGKELGRKRPGDI